MKNKWKLLKWKKIILKSGIFDLQYYLFTYNDVRISDIDPIIHYLKYGANEGRNPSEKFNTTFYLNKYPDVKTSNLNPLVHYILFGKKEKRLIFQQNNIQNPKTIEYKESNNVYTSIQVRFEVVKFLDNIKNISICILVTHSIDGKIKEHTKYLIKKLKKYDIKVILAVATDNYKQCIDIDLDTIDGLIVRENIGYDFALWAQIINIYSDIWSVDKLYLVNDSIFGPISDDKFKNMLNKISNSKADIIGLTENHENNYHLQSYFLIFQNNSLSSEYVKLFWREIKSYSHKIDVIRNYELRFTNYFKEKGLTIESIFTLGHTPKKHNNPTLSSSNKLINLGFPFYKVELLKDNPKNDFIDDWEKNIADNNLLQIIKDNILNNIKINRNNVIYEYNKSFTKVLPTFNDNKILSAIRLNPKYDYSIKTPFQFIKNSDILKYQNIKVAVIIHIFYIDLIDEILQYLKNIPIKADLFISTNSHKKSIVIKKSFNNYINGNVNVKVCKNRGRDVAPMLIDFHDVFYSYEWILHIHSKKSPHNTSELFAWRKYLFDELLGSTKQILSIFNLLSYQEVGVVFPEHFNPVKKSLNFGYNYPTMKKLLLKLGITYTPENILEFPSSTMFWFKSKALHPLLDLKLTYNDFDKENAQTDGTLAHSLERSILLICESTNHKWCKICSNATNKSNLIVPYKEDDVKTILKTLFYRLIDNQIVLDGKRQIKEYSDIMTYKDITNKPRLNIILPTLKKEKIFGGISTALKFFNELKKQLGKDFQYRILVSSEEVSPDDIENFENYVLLNLHNHFDKYDNIIMDINRFTDGYLGLRKNDFFIATAWWTAMNAYSFCNKQKQYFKSSPKVIYLIQDHEPGFYNWSSRYILAKSTYIHNDDTIAIINSEELASFMLKRYHFDNSFVLPFTINNTLKNNIKSMKKEKIILFYGRPSVDRNAFEFIIDALYQWQKSNPIIADEWKIISLGELYPKWRTKHIKNISIEGKVSLEQYSKYLNISSIGISLMISPHPSYPPLEMAYANIKTITNIFENKDLSLRSDNIISIELESISILSKTLEKTIQNLTFDTLDLNPIKNIKLPTEEYTVDKLCKIIQKGINFE